MKLAPFFLGLIFSQVAFAAPESGPMSHERTDTPTKKDAHVGRYLYVGAAPKFASNEIDLTVSKMSLTVRATGWMTQAEIDGYAQGLYDRWELITQSMENPKFELHPLMKLQSIPTKLTSIAWAKIAGQYSSHVLENRDLEIYNARRNANNLNKSGTAESYQTKISVAILRYFFQDNTLTPEAVTSDNLLRDNLVSVENSRLLFKKHYQSLFTVSSAKPGYVGKLTFVYPIAATVKGAFDQPAERVTSMRPYGTVEARWHSDKWDDEFGGLPFILINDGGVAFHGPITNFEPLDVWYLRRDYVSHGCHRMDSSDIMELRYILHLKNADLGKVKLTILNNFDVTDWNHDGVNEVIDVKYYNIPSYVEIPKGKTSDQVIKPYLVENQMKSFFQTNVYAKPFYNVKTDTIDGAVRYNVVNGVLTKIGNHKPLPIYRFNYQPSRVLQYKELGVQLIPYDDNRGELPPVYYLKPKI